MPLQQAIDNILSDASPKTGSLSLDLHSALNHVLAGDIVSARNVPPADNSAMDGYGFCHQSCCAGKAMTQVGVSLAGQPFDGVVRAGECVRITTGGVVPKGVDCIIMQEEVSVQGKEITPQRRPELGNNIRRAGEDIASGDVVLARGTRLQPAQLALLASIGIATVEVVTPLKVALIATGDELVSPGDELAAGQIFESNRFALRGLLLNLGLDVLDLGIIEDDEQALRRAFEHASQCDLIISCGGVSVGDADLVKQVLDDLGSLSVWRIAIKPGKPFAYGRLGEAHFCGLPGNPVSAFVTFQMLVKPLIQRLMGDNSPVLPVLKAMCTSTVKKRHGRADFQRGWFQTDPSGQLTVTPLPKQGSGIMTSITQANCYLLLSEQDRDYSAGQSVDILPFAFLNNS